MEQHAPAAGIQRDRGREREIAIRVEDHRRRAVIDDLHLRSIQLFARIQSRGDRRRIAIDVNHRTIRFDRSTGGQIHNAMIDIRISTPAARFVLPDQVSGGHQTPAWTRCDDEGVIRGPRQVPGVILDERVIPGEVARRIPRIQRINAVQRAAGRGAGGSPITGVIGNREIGHRKGEVQERISIHLVEDDGVIRHQGRARGLQVAEGETVVARVPGNGHIRGRDINPAALRRQIDGGLGAASVCLGDGIEVVIQDLDGTRGDARIDANHHQPFPRHVADGVALIELANQSGAGATHGGVLDSRIGAIGDGVVQDLEIGGQHRNAIPVVVRHGGVTDDDARHDGAAAVNVLALEVLDINGIDGDVGEGAVLPQIDGLVGFVPSIAGGGERRIRGAVADTLGIAVRHPIQVQVGDCHIGHELARDTAGSAVVADCDTVAPDRAGLAGILCAVVVCGPGAAAEQVDLGTTANQGNIVIPYFYRAGCVSGHLVRSADHVAAHRAAGARGRLRHRHRPAARLPRRIDRRLKSRMIVGAVGVSGPGNRGGRGSTEHD